MTLFRRKKDKKRHEEDPFIGTNHEGQVIRPGHPTWEILMSYGIQGFDEEGVPIGEGGEDMRPHLRKIGVL